VEKIAQNNTIIIKSANNFKLYVPLNDDSWIVTYMTLYGIWEPVGDLMF